MAIRAGSLAERFQRLEIRLVYRRANRLRSLSSMARDLLNWQPQVCCVFDHALDGVLIAMLAKLLLGCVFVLDTGDAIVEIGKALGRGRVSLALTRGLEVAGLRTADQIVVRSRYHQDWLGRQGFRAEVIPDGVDVSQFAPDAGAIAEPRQRPPLRIGVLGSCTWSPLLKLCYGWELVQVLRLLPAELARGVFIGDGDGLPRLRRQAEEAGVAERIDFQGRVPYADLPRRLHELDICLSTQTNDLAGRVRTTGKLPLYLAAGRFVLATRVGTAAEVLPEKMLMDYEDTVDAAYPQKLAQRIQSLAQQGETFGYQPHSVELARRHFDYQTLACRYECIVERAAQRSRGFAGNCRT
jgi:glycosyltransferase involved in cell wall biosynthesis